MTDPLPEAPSPVPVARFDELPADEADDLLRVCCCTPRWVSVMRDGRPYGDAGALLQASDAAFATFDAADVAAALAGHPRIGERVQGAGGAAAFSRTEQSAVGAAREQVQLDLAAGNRAYEDRFDQVFLIRAAGRPPEEILSELRRRLGNDERSEQVEVVEQLRQITRLRLAATLR